MARLNTTAGHHHFEKMEAKRKARIASKFKKPEVKIKAEKSKDKP